MIDLRPRLLVPIVALFACACATSSSIQMADGSTAHDVSCFAGHWACASEAKKVCGGRPYVVLDDDAVLEIASKGQQGSMRVQCVDDYAAANARVEDAPVAPRRAPPTPSDGAACRTAYRDVSGLARSWGNARGVAPKPEPPTADTFLRACLSLPNEAQLCLYVDYRRTHATCAKTLGALDDAAKARLDDALLLRRSDQHAPPDVLDL
jgi:hypothetical protein